MKPAQFNNQEPVAWMDADGNVSDNNDHKCFPIPLYTTPPQQEPVIDKSAAIRIATSLGWTPQRKPLTDAELRVIESKINPNMRWRSSDEEGITLYPQEYYDLVQAIEAAHGIKENT